MLRYLLYALAYLAVLPMFSGCTRLIRQPNDAAFYGGCAVAFFILGYVYIVTKKLYHQITADLDGIESASKQ